MPSFNLIDEPWIPCLLAKDGGEQELPLRETLLRAHEITAITGESPLVTISLHRLLLAVLHRCFGPENAAAWSVLWQRGAFDAAVVNAYLDQWVHRFDLFDDERPFYQVPIDPSRGVYQIARKFQFAKGVMLFNHASPEEPLAFSPAEAARLMIAFQDFDVGGTQSAEVDKDFARSGMLNQSAVALVRGGSLFETLMLNFHRYSPTNDEPFAFNREIDSPAWERDLPLRSAVRHLDGYMDLLTWQSRRMRLLPELDLYGKTVTRYAIVMVGYQLPKEVELHGKETMIAFRRVKKPKEGQSPWAIVGFQEGRALWRDSMSILQSVGGASARPKMLAWLSDLVTEGYISKRSAITINFHGLVVKKADALFWRSESFAVPPAYLSDHELHLRLGSALELAETGGDLIQASPEKKGEAPRPFWKLGELLLGTKGKIPELVKHLAPGRVYWAALEEPFRRLLVELPDDPFEDAIGTPVVGPAVQRWADQVERAAWDAFAAATEGLDGSARTLRAVAEAERAMRAGLRETVGPFTSRGGTVATVGGRA